MANSPPSVERVILDHIFAGTLSIDFARSLIRQRDRYRARQAEYRKAHPGMTLAMVRDQLIFASSYAEMIDRLQREYPGEPFFLDDPAMYPDALVRA